MKKRMSRTNEGRKSFKIDSLLDRRAKEDSEQCVTNLGSFLTLTFLGYYDKQVGGSGPTQPRVRLELLLVKLSHKKRKESSSPVVQVRRELVTKYEILCFPTQVSLGTSEVPVNPSEESPPSKAPALSIPSKSFSLSGLSGVGRGRTYSLLVRVLPECSGEQQPGMEENTEPAAKRRKGPGGRAESNTARVVSAELVVYDKGLFRHLDTQITKEYYI